MCNSSVLLLGRDEAQLVQTERCLGLDLAGREEKFVELLAKVGS